MVPCGGEMAKKWVVGQFPITAFIRHFWDPKLSHYSRVAGTTWQRG
jgi:hypothetical protein